MAYLLIIVACGLALTYLVGYCYRGASWAKTLVKTGSVVCLALAAGLMGGPWLLVLALVLSAIGDFCLSREGDGIFMVGVGGFAAAHLAYIALFLGLPEVDLTTGPRVIECLALLTLGGVMMPVLWKRAGDLRIPVMGYVPIIMGMGIAALTLPIVWPLGLVVLGAGFFVASDFILALEMFVLDDAARKKWRVPFLVWATYWPAQALIFWGIMA